MPSFATRALVTFFLLAFVTSGRAYGADPTVLHVCIGPAGVMRAVAPSEPCPPNHIRVHVPIGAPSAVSFCTVERPVETFGPLTLTSVSVSCEEGDQVLSGGGRPPPAPPGGRGPGRAPPGR